MTRETVSITGFAELERSLGEFESTATRRNIALRALGEAALIIRDAIRGFAPVEDADLRDAISVGVRRGSAGNFKENRTARQIKGFKRGGGAVKFGLLQVFVGVDINARAVNRRGVEQVPPWVYQSTIEFGRADHPAHPHMRPGFDASKQAAVNDLIRTLTEQIGKAAERAARKAARNAGG